MISILHTVVGMGIRWGLAGYPSDLHPGG